MTTRRDFLKGSAAVAAAVYAGIHGSGATESSAKLRFINGDVVRVSAYPTCLSDEAMARLAGYRDAERAQARLSAALRAYTVEAARHAPESSEYCVYGEHQTVVMLPTVEVTRA